MITDCLKRLLCCKRDRKRFDSEENEDLDSITLGTFPPLSPDDQCSRYGAVENEKTPPKEIALGLHYMLDQWKIALDRNKGQKLSTSERLEEFYDNLPTNAAYPVQSQPSQNTCLKKIM